MCVIEECARPAKRRGFCGAHWQRIETHGDPMASLPVRHRARNGEAKGCNVEGCERPHESRGLCATHARRERKGAPLDVPVQVRNEPGTLGRCSKGHPYTSWSGAGRRLCRTCHQLTQHRISDASLAAMTERQGGRCAICHRVRPLCVDHDHGHCAGSWGCSVCVRGLLCESCNRALGQFGDSIELLEAAIAYLVGSRLDAVS